MARRAQYLVGLDVGSSKIAAIVGEVIDDASVDIIGIGVAEARGIRRGVVVNLEAAVESIKKAIEEAELTAGVEIDTVHLGLSGTHVKAFNSRGVVAVAGKNREITREDVRRAIDAAKAVALPSGREILHVLPQDFVVDEQDGIGAPVGMIITIERQMGSPQFCDLGIFIANIMLLARERGLHTCPQEAWSLWGQTIREQVGVPDDELVFCGIALGYAVPDSAVNQLRSERAQVDEFAQFRGYTEL